MHAPGVGSLACFAIALLLSALVVGDSLRRFFINAEATTLPAAPLMALLHVVGIVGTILGFAGRRRDWRARWGLWLNSVLLVVFWLGVALWPF